MRRPLVPLLALVAACSSSGSGDSPDADVPDPDAAADAMLEDASTSGFGVFSSMCDVIDGADLTSAAPTLFHVSVDFTRQYADATDRPLLTAGGQILAATPNAGGSSGLSEIFAYEELDRCEQASLLKTETQIVYAPGSKKTDILVELEGLKIGVSVTRAFAFPLGNPYPLAQATGLVTDKLNDIKLSTAGVSDGDRWTKQILSILAYDDQAAQTVEEAWNGLDAETKGDTVVVVIATNGADTFIYTNQ
jgi:hypothetical protein